MSSFGLIEKNMELSHIYVAVSIVMLSIKKYILVYYFLYFWPRSRGLKRLFLSTSTSSYFL